MFEEAAELIKLYHITTAIPVLDKQGKIVYEINCSIEKESEERVLRGYHDKFVRFLNSFYLKDDVKILCEMLSNQKIVVIGEEERFNKIFKDVFINTQNIIFISDIPINGYRFLADHTELILDLMANRYNGRVEIYSRCNNGYGWESFWEEILSNLEKDYISMMYRVLERRKDIFDSY